MSDIMGCFCGNTVRYKRPCYIHILNAESHLSAFFHPAGDFGILAREFLYTISLLFPVYFSEMLSEASWYLQLGSFRALFSGVGWAPTQSCVSLDMPQLVVSAWGYLLTSQLKMGTMRCSKNLPTPPPQTKYFKKLGLKELSCKH